MPQRRDEDARRRIIAAVQQLVAEKGPAQATVTEISARAGVGRQTIYRWWRNRSLLVIDALIEMADSEFNFADSGRFEADLRRQMHRMAVSFAGPLGALIKELIGDSQGDPSIGEAFRIAFFERRRDQARRFVRRGIELGVLRDDIDVDGVAYALYAPLWLALIIGHEPLTKSLADRAMNAALSGHHSDKTLVRASRDR
jgi:AcrR family transcriptional regulator